jgi:hypothetical protein
MLQSALDQYRQQQRITALGLRQARKVAPTGLQAVARVIATYQVAAIALAVGSTEDVIAEQGIKAPPVAQVGAASLLTGSTATRLLEIVDTAAAFDRLVSTLIQDAGRTAAVVDIASRPALTGYVRSLNPPSCSRCAVLAGRVYRYSDGFQRHPGCDCIMSATTTGQGPFLVTDPTDLLESGQIRGLSKGDMEALDNGADLGRVVNVRRKQAGLTVGSSVYSRAGQLTPQGVLNVASDRAQAIELLRQYGYLL